MYSSITLCRSKKKVQFIALILVFLHTFKFFNCLWLLTYVERAFKLRGSYAIDLFKYMFLFQLLLQMK